MRGFENVYTREKMASMLQIKKKVGKIDRAFIFHMANYDRFQPKVQCTF